MNFLEKEMQDALEKENAIRKKDGLPPLKSNMTIIYCTEEPHTELKKLDDEGVTVHKVEVDNKFYG